MSGCESTYGAAAPAAIGAGAAAHVPVLRDAVLRGLEPALASAAAAGSPARVVDGTFGRGGHAQALLAMMQADGQLLALDRDPEAQAAAEVLAEAEPRIIFRRARFSELRTECDALGWTGGVDAVLLDVGVSSPQLDDAGRGFSFMRDGPLDLRMDPDSGISAADWLADADEAEIADVLRRYGEERAARRIARRICAARTDAPITRTTQLAALVRGCFGKVPRHALHPATRTFQALRIQVNGELDELAAVLPMAIDVLRPGGRLAVISFHSLEDRITKLFVRRESGREPRLRGGLPAGPETPARLRGVGGAQRADETEIESNPRARSATLRVAERVAEIVAEEVAEKVAEPEVRS